MKKATFKTASTALAVLLALTLVFTAIFAISDSVAEADDTMQGISIGKHTVAQSLFCS